MDGKQEIIAEFDKCPLCKLREELAEILGKPELALGDGTKRFAGSVAAEQVEKGLFRGDVKFGLHSVGGKVFDPRFTGKVIIGATKIPDIVATLDACLDCGCVYAIELIKQEDVLKTRVIKPRPGSGG